MAANADENVNAKRQLSDFDSSLGEPSDLSECVGGSDSWNPTKLHETVRTSHEWFREPPIKFPSTSQSKTCFQDCDRHMQKTGPPSKSRAHRRDHFGNTQGLGIRDDEGTPKRRG